MTSYHLTSEFLFIDSSNYIMNSIIKYFLNLFLYIEKKMKGKIYVFFAVLITLSALTLANEEGKIQLFSILT